MKQHDERPCCLLDCGLGLGSSQLAGRALLWSPPPGSLVAKGLCPVSAGPWRGADPSSGREVTRRLHRVRTLC